MRLTREDIILLHILVPENLREVSWAAIGNLEFHLSEDQELLEDRLTQLHQRFAEALSQPAKETP